MNRWKRINRIWSNWHPESKHLIEIVGGSYLGAKPQITYKRLFDELYKLKISIHAFTYLPTLNHQYQANEAWKNFRVCKEYFQDYIGENVYPIRVGHSLGCKLNFLSPDFGRNIKGLVSISFNNFNATKSIPFIQEISKRLGVNDEFSPNPNETLNLISKKYLQINNLIIRFTNDNLDQSKVLSNCLSKRSENISKIITIPGNHLTPVSAGLRENILGDWADDLQKAKSIENLASTINQWANNNLDNPN